MRYYVTIGEREVEVDLSGPIPRVDGVDIPAELSPASVSGARSLLAAGRSVTLHASPGERRGRWRIAIGAERLTVDVVDERTRAIRAMTGDTADAVVKSVVAPMPGLVVKVEVQVGDSVRAGQGVVVVEAMKMENELKAPADGVVAHVAVEPGRTVEKGTLLLTLE